MAKILEHLIKNRLEWFLESKDVLPKSQFGFRKSLSTMDSLSTLVTDIRIAFSKNEYLVGVFLDISSAYDNVLLQLKSLPQGSVLSPILYTIYTFDLDLAVNSICNVLQYADDLALYISTDNLTTANSRLNSTMEYLQCWLTDHGLSLSVSKSSIVIFTRHKNVPNIPVLYNGLPIPIRDKVKFLGMVLDNKLSFTQHIEYISKKCDKNINILRSLSGVWWGSHPFSQKLLYNATRIIRSHLDYGCFLLEPCNKSSLKTLDKIQYKCLRIIIGAMKSYPINALQVECVDPPLNIRRQYLSDRFFFKICQLSSHPLIPRLHLLSEFLSSSRYWLHKDCPHLFNSLVSFLQIPGPIFSCNTSPLFNTPFKAIIYQPNIHLDLDIRKGSPEADLKLKEAIGKNWKDWMTMCTDASKNTDDGCTGAAVWIPRFKIIFSFKCPSLCSIFTAETIAIHEALLYIESHSLDKTVIFSDSKSCLSAILANQFQSKYKFPLILDIKSILYRCHLKGISVCLAWIPSHSGICENDKADLCAKEATRNGTPLNVTYSHDLLSLARRKLVNTWNEIWKASQILKGKHYAAIQDNIPSRPWFFIFNKANKRATSIVCRLRIGHACTYVHLAKLRIRDSSLCECGLNEGNTNHIFFNCTKLSSSLYDYLPSDIPRPIDFNSLLIFTNTSFVYILCDFINSNNIKL
ncbi:unnamed protein product [Parnassius mnemosyne]|uniref:RNA-directed DNA polymerase from mobile element jockey n=1 Tax=Parnassius mnemosyne TaxID=213953 RepID=A0AAV1LPU5_9NEOP